MFESKEIKLYDIQNQITDTCRQEMKFNKKIILMAATGLGKTIIATWMIKQAYMKDLRCLFVCDRISLINQTSEVFESYGLRHGIYQADNPLYAPDMPIQIGSIQTLARRKQRDYDFIIFDEIHSFFKAHEKILKHNKDSFFLGLSATPFSKELGKYFDKHIEPVPMKKLISMGYLCKFEIYGPSTIDLSKVRTVAGDYKEEDLSKAADKPKLVADVVKTWIKLACNTKTIVFSVNVAHSRHLEKEFVKRGVLAREINGYMQKEGDDGANKIIQDFRDNKFKVLISVEMLTKGFDVPDVGCVVFATATKSPIKWIQSCGRGIRTHPEKTICRILDHGSNAERLGFPDDYEFLGLDDGKHSRQKNKKKDRPEKLPKKCTSCDYLKPAGVQKCSACGFIPKFVEDQPSSEGELKKLQRKAKSEYTLAQKQSFLSQLNQHALNKGYKLGWGSWKYKEKFGTFPRGITKTAVEPVGEEVSKYIKYLNIKAFNNRKKKGDQKNDI